MEFKIELVREIREMLEYKIIYKEEDFEAETTLIVVGSLGSETLTYSNDLLPDYVMDFIEKYLAI